MARQSMCANHRDTPAIARCLHCNRSICEKCTREITGGRFCSEEHAERYLQFAAERRPIKVPRHYGCLSKSILLILLVGAIALGLHLFGFHVPYVSDALGPSPLISEETVVPVIPGEKRKPATEKPAEDPDSTRDSGDRPAAPAPDPALPTPMQF